MRTPSLRTLVTLLSVAVLASCGRSSPIEGRWVAWQGGEMYVVAFRPDGEFLMPASPRGESGLYAVRGDTVVVSLRGFGTSGSAVFLRRGTSLLVPISGYMADSLRRGD